MINAEAEQGTLASRAGEVFQRFRDGDSQAMGELVAMLTPILWHTVRAQRLDKESTEDVLQTTWLALVRGADTIADPRAVLQWLIVSARREAWRVMRGQSRRQWSAALASATARSPALPAPVPARRDRAAGRCGTAGRHASRGCRCERKPQRPGRSPAG